MRDEIFHTHLSAWKQSNRHSMLSVNYMDYLQFYFSQENNMFADIALLQFIGMKLWYVSV